MAGDPCLFEILATPMIPFLKFRHCMKLTFAPTSAEQKMNSIDKHYKFFVFFSSEVDTPVRGFEELREPSLRKRRHSERCVWVMTVNRLFRWPVGWGGGSLVSTRLRSYRAK